MKVENAPGRARHKTGIGLGSGANVGHTAKTGRNFAHWRNSASCHTWSLGNVAAKARFEPFPEIQFKLRSGSTGLMFDDSIPQVDRSQIGISSEAKLRNRNDL
jgi:hypothetical protein